jgi:hypothetical protein
MYTAWVCIFPFFPPVCSGQLPLANPSL